MADSQDAIELKRRARRRLVGAIALVVFVVIALPIVLDREPKPISQDLSIQIPSQDASKFSSRVLPVEPPAPPAVVAEPAPVAAPKTEAPKPEASKAEARPADTKVVEAKPAAPVPVPVAKPEAPAPKAAAAEAAKPESKPAPVQKPAATAATKDSSSKEAPKAAAVAESKSGESFFVPLGMFSKADNIKQVRGKAGSAGFKTFTENVAGSDNVRVRAGPFTSRDAAEKARDKLKGAGLDVGAVAVK